VKTILQLKLLNPSSSRFEHLVTQMKWRLREGRGEAIYEIGVADNGLLHGLSQNDLDSSLETLKRMALKYVFGYYGAWCICYYHHRLGATVTILQNKCVSSNPHQRFVVEALVRKVPDDQLVSVFKLPSVCITVHNCMCACE